MRWCRPRRIHPVLRFVGLHIVPAPPPPPPRDTRGRWPAAPAHGCGAVGAHLPFRGSALRGGPLTQRQSAAEEAAAMGPETHRHSPPPPPPPERCIGRAGASKAAPEAVRQAVGGGCRSGLGGGY